MQTPAPLKRLAIVPFVALLAACGDRAPDAEETAAPAAAAAPQIDWSACRPPGLGLPIEGRVFVVDGGPPPEGAEAGRESIRRVEVVVPGTVSLLLTAADATVWHLRLSPQTQLRAVLASGTQPQRITGQGLGNAVLVERSVATGTPCGRYWLANGAGPELAEAAEQVFGKKYDALYGLSGGQVVIGDPETQPLSATPNPAASAPPPPPRPTLTTQVVLSEAVRDRLLRPAEAGELSGWLQRNGALENKRRDAADETRLGGQAYVVIGDFRVPAHDTLADTETVLLLVDARTPVAVSPGKHWPVLDMETGSCSGQMCSFILD
jgi:hypothetical protein